MTTILHTGVVKQGKFVKFALAVLINDKLYYYTSPEIRLYKSNTLD